MSDYDHRNQAFDYAPPRSGGSGAGVLALIGGIVALLLLGFIFLGTGTSPLPDEGGEAPAVESAPPATAVPTE